MKRVENDSQSTLPPPPKKGERFLGFFTAASFLGTIGGGLSVHASQDSMNGLSGYMSTAAIDQTGERYTRALRDLYYPQKSFVLSISDAKSQLQKNIISDKTPGDKQKNVDIIHTLDTAVYRYRVGQPITNTLASARSDIQVVQDNMDTVQSAKESIRRSMYLNESESITKTALAGIATLTFGSLYWLTRKRRTSDY